MSKKSLYERLGGYDGIVAVVDNLLPRLAGDAKLGRFWAHRGSDGLTREKQLLIDFLAHAAGGPMYYTGRDMKLSHVGMGIDAQDWRLFIGHVEATLDAAHCPAPERGDVLGFIGSLRGDMVEG
jgi:hemoglobin